MPSASQRGGLPADATTLRTQRLGEQAGQRAIRAAAVRVFALASLGPRPPLAGRRLLFLAPRRIDDRQVRLGDRELRRR